LAKKDVDLTRSDGGLSRKDGEKFRGNEVCSRAREVPKEDAVGTGTALNKKNSDWNLAVGRCWKLKKHTRGNGGSQKKLAADNRRMTRHAQVARPKGYSHQGHSRNNAVREAKTEMQKWNKVLRPETAAAYRKQENKIIRKTFRLGFVNPIAGSSIRMQEVSDRTLWTDRHPPKWKKTLHTE
jgi:hypothetical protein